MASLLRKVQARVSIPAHRRTRGMLEGEYSSVFHGRSIEFDDLRHYVVGDEMKDIDWKATARMGAPMTRRYIAARKHTIMLVADTGRDMAATAADGSQKSAIAIYAAGVLAYLATRHGDLVGIIAGDADHTEYRGPESTDAHLERMLQLMHSRTTLESGPSSLARQLDYIATRFRRRMILVVISDDRMPDAREVALLRRLGVQHEILWLSIGDADPTRQDWSDTGMYDVLDGSPLPAYVRGDRRLARAFATATAERVQRADDIFDSLTISRRRIASEADVVPELFRLIEGHRHARR